MCARSVRGWNGWIEKKCIYHLQGGCVTKKGMEKEGIEVRWKSSAHASSPFSNLNKFVEDFKAIKKHFKFFISKMENLHVRSKKDFNEGKENLTWAPLHILSELMDIFLNFLKGKYQTSTLIFILLNAQTHQCYFIFFQLKKCIFFWKAECL